MSGAFRSTLQQLRSKAWVLHEPPGAFLELLILGCAHSSLNFCFSLALASFDFVLHVPPRSPCESPRWRFLAVAGVAEEARAGRERSPCRSCHGRKGWEQHQEPSHAISCLPLLSRAAISGQEQPLEVHAHLSGAPAPAEPL